MALRRMTYFESLDRRAVAAKRLAWLVSRWDGLQQYTTWDKVLVAQLARNSNVWTVARLDLPPTSNKG